MCDVTRILSQIESGDSKAAERLLPLVYDELRKLAASKFANEKPGQTLQATALVHEAYLRIVGDGSSDSWSNRGHFFGAAAEAMRRILVEQARKKMRIRHGGEFERVDLDTDIALTAGPDDNILDLHEALTKLEEADSARAELIKLRYFAGLTVAQSAEAMGISVTTAERYWRFGKAWLLAEISDDSDSAEKK